MALIVRGIKCPICGEALGTGNIFATWGVFLAQDDPLCGFCDAGMHWACYETWPHRPRFAKAYFESWIEHEKTNPYWGKVYCDDLILVTVNPHLPLEQVETCLSSTGSRLRISLDRWCDWLDDKENKPPLNKLEREALAFAIPQLRAKFPDANTLVGAVDWDSKGRMVKEANVRHAKVEEERLLQVAAHNKACLKMELQRKHGGLTCQNCGQHSSDFRYMDNAPQRKSYFICNKCAHTVEPA